MANRWKSSPLLWQEWDGETVVFNRDSGNTHLLTPTAVEVLRIIQAEPLDAAQIAKYLLGPSDEHLDEGLVKKLENLLQELDHLGIVEPVYSESF